MAGNYTEEIAVTATDGSLRYYWSYDGTPPGKREKGRQRVWVLAKAYQLRMLTKSP